jgi:hypothetical protein
MHPSLSRLLVVFFRYPFFWFLAFLTAAARYVISYL